MIEHVIEQSMAPPPRQRGQASLVEAVLGRWLWEAARPARRAIVELAPPPAEIELCGAHRPAVAEELATDGLEVDDRFPGLHRFGRLLEVGAGHLEAARAAYREQGRKAAVQARALAAFAAARPASVLDRPDDEVGAAAAASRAARPAPLTEVSEWAV